MTRVGAEVVVVSDRGPIAFSRTAAGLVAERRRGGLVTTLEAATAGLDDRVTWVATTPGEWDGAAAAEAYDAGVALSCVRVPPQEYWAYYDDAGVRLLWFANHDLWEELDRPAANPDAMAAYERVNRRVAEHVHASSAPDTPVLVQDYQLATAPEWLRRLAPGRPVAHMTCTPFGPPSAFAHLPGVLRTVVEGMLAADVVGFLHRPWAACFLACCRALGARVSTERGLVEHAGRRTWVRCYPLGTELEHADGAPRGSGVRTIVRADRLDPAKNVIRGFQAFELLLERRPDLRGEVVFASYPVASRERVPEYVAYQRRLDAEVARIGARFPGAIQVHPGRGRREALDALRGADVLLVNSLRDGMNLVAQEGPMVNPAICVVLSSATGSAGLLGDGPLRLDDPRDTGRTAALLERALAMPLPERRRRTAEMRAAIAAHRPQRWLAEQLADVRAAAGGGEPSAGGW